VRALGALLVALAACAVLAPGGQAANECSGLPQCISVPGPWVIVPARGEVDFLLECPGRAVVGGTDALVSSQAIQVSFDGIPGSPVSFGRTTNFEVLFRAVSADHHAGSFEPFLGCIPTSSGGRETTGVKIEPLGPALDLRAANIAPSPGRLRSASLGCPDGELLVDSWTATAFATLEPPAPALAAAIRVRSAVRGGLASATVAAAAALPRGTQALVQLGVRCASG
jgi:hypothetical protein